MLVKIFIAVVLMVLLINSSEGRPSSSRSSNYFHRTRNERKFARTTLPYHEQLHQYEEPRYYRSNRRHRRPLVLLVDQDPSDEHRSRIVAVPQENVQIEYEPKDSGAEETYVASATDHGGEYGHDEYGHKGGYKKHDDVSGYLDAGAYTGGYGAFGWYADYPVGGGYN